MPHVVVKSLLIFLFPVVQAHAVRKNRIMRIGQDR